jgi:hypothetical protein
VTTASPDPGGAGSVSPNPGGADPASFDPEGAGSVSPDHGAVDSVLGRSAGLTESNF